MFERTCRILRGWGKLGQRAHLATPYEEPTGNLLNRLAAGEEDARSALVSRYLGPLERFARGRLPLGARDLVDTGDIVQEVLVRVLGNLDHFNNQGVGALFGYFRRAVLNRLRDEARRVSRTPPREPMGEQPGHLPSPLEELLGRESVERFEGALALLASDEQALLVARIEMGLTYPEIARDFGKPSADAARMAVGRALAKLSRHMSDPGVSPAPGSPGRS